MNVLLISANTERINLATLPYGLALVSASVRAAGHEVAMHDLLREADPLPAIARDIPTFRPGAIGISVRNIDDQCMQHPRFLLEQVTGVVAACRARSSAPIILGGAGYSIFPGAALDYLGADFGVCGEGEAVLPALLSRLEAGHDAADLPGIYITGCGDSVARTLVPNLDLLPFPEEDMWPTTAAGDADLWVPVQSRRGCPLDCSYCSTPRIEGRTLRVRAPWRVAAEMASLARRGFRRFYFVDNTFNRPVDYALELCRSIVAERLDIAWRCILYPQDVPEELVQVMAAAGCVEAGLGFESGSPSILRAMNKRFLPGEVREISDRLAAHGIRRMGFLLLGGPEETQETVEESLAFAESLHLDQLKTTVGIRIYPDTPLAHTALREGVIGPEDDLLFPRFYLTPDLEIPTHPAGSGSAEGPPSP
ncbi:MAG TPA: radical SAM protein [Candidatus Methylomirabilis sp.]|nr:radical SAM protein [Candidatus Methylomirabilis sp.]